MTKGGSLSNIMNPLPDIESLIQNGPIAGPQKFVVYGVDGVGKTTWASRFPSPLFIDGENGTRGFDVNRIATPDSDAFHNTMRSLLKAADLKFRTIVFDTVESVERFQRERILRIHRVDSLESVAYGKLWHHLREVFERWLVDLNRLADRGLNIVVIGHSTVRKYQAPDATVAFDRFSLKLYDHNADALRQWSDHVFFMNWDVRAVENRGGKPRGAGGRTRVLYTTYSPAWDAKTRGNLPEKIPCEFGALLPLFGPQLEEVRKEEGSAVSASSPAEKETAPSPPSAELRDQLLNTIGDLENELVCRYLAARKLIPSDGDIDSLSANQAQWIVNHKDDFRARVEKFAHEPF